jgi:hypothetical protein
MPSKAAKRAAKKICSKYGMLEQHHVMKVAKIIDRETALPQLVELVAAMELLLDEIENSDCRFNAEKVARKTLALIEKGHTDAD